MCLRAVPPHVGYKKFFEVALCRGRGLKFKLGLPHDHGFLLAAALFMELPRRYLVKAVPYESAAPALRDVSPPRVRREDRILPGVPAGRPAEREVQTGLFDAALITGRGLK